MCGIFGIYDNDNQIDVDLLTVEGNKIKHRGPDDTSCIINNDYFLMFHRLAINGLTKSGNQPMVLDAYDDLILMANAEIYNFKELANEYNIKLTTGSDCEIIIHLYKRLGIHGCIQKLDGVFSFFIMDKSKNQIIIGHDPIGIRSLYWSTHDNKLCFSSEMKSLVNITDNIEMYPPGSYTKYDMITNEHYTTKYFELQSLSLSLYNDDNIIVDNIKDHLYKAVNKRLLSERKIGCLLSGGIDSSIITMIASEIIGPKNLKTFSIGLKDSSDLQYAQLVADHLGTDHTTIEITYDDLLSSIPECIKQIESYDITTVRASTPMYLLSKYINENTDITVILSGEGADEASGSYLYFHNHPGPKEFNDECLRLIKDVQHFDVLRGDKTTAGNSLEIRVPFFDKEFLKFYMNVNPINKIPRDGYEKYLLRKAYEDKLPDEIIWRRKDGFSDSISDKKRSWYESINDHCIDKKYLVDSFEYLKPHTKESCWYRGLFNEYYSNQQNIVPYFWLPKWSGDQLNPSGRLIINDKY